MEKIVIDNKILKYGVSITDDDDNAGFSPDQDVTYYGACNLRAVDAKKIVPQPYPNIKGAAVIEYSDYGVLAFCNDKEPLGNDAYFVDGNGNFYKLDGSTVTKAQTDSTNTYTAGTSEIITFKNNIYATSQGDIAKLTSNMATLDATWWTVTEGNSALQTQYRHPMEVVEDTLYIADKDKIHTFDGTTSVSGAMTLPNNCNITTLIKHQDGRHLIAFTSDIMNYSHTLNTGGKVYIIDTLTLEFINEIEVGTQVEGSINVGGIIYVTYGDNFGYFNGSSINFLRKLNVTDRYIYNNKLTADDNILYIAEDKRFLAFGEIAPGTKAFWYPFSYYDVNASTFKSIFKKGDNKFLFSWNDTLNGTTKLEELDFDKYNYTAWWRSNRYQFSDDVWVRRVDVIIDDATNHNGDIDISIIDGNGSETAIGTIEYANDGEAGEKRIDCNVKLDQLQIQLYFNNISSLTNCRGVKKLIIHYEQD